MRALIYPAPDQAEVLYDVGSLLWEMGKPAEAFPYLERAARVCPTDAGILVQLALALAERREFAAAKDRLTAAKRLDPGDRRIDQAISELARRQRSGRRRRKAA